MGTGKGEKSTLSHKIFTIVGIVLCVILIPILIINCILIIKGATNEDEVPSIGGVFPMIVLTDSMSGTFESGDLIICKEIDPNKIVVGDVITYFDPDSSNSAVVTHRVIELTTDRDGGLAFITQGDANNIADPTAIPDENLIGIYVDIRIPGMGRVALFMQTIPGLIVCVFVPLLALVAYDVIRRKLYDRKHGDDKQQLLQELEELRRQKAELAAANEAAANQATAQPIPPSVEETSEKSEE